MKNAKNVREWMDSTSDVSVETDCGPLWICVNGPDTLHIATKPIYGNQQVPPYITIRGIEYHASAHLVYVPRDVKGPEDSDAANEIQVRKGWRVAPATYQRGDGKVANWRIRDGLYASRKGSVSIHDTTPAATRKLVEVIEEAANRWASTPEAREAIRDGSIRSLSNDSRSDEEKIAEKEKEIAELHAKVKARDAQIAKLRK
jgi:hypothetical protein